jgi:aminoglycoside 3'-phosphotransferase II
MDIPPAIRAFVVASECDRVHTGKSGASVTRLRTQHSGTVFLKTCETDAFAGLAAEAERLRWLAGRLTVPNVVAFARDGGREYLLVTGLPGVNGVEAGRERPAEVATQLAQALTVLHAQPLDGCPFDETVAVQIERARHRVCAGVVDESDFDEERWGRTARELFIQLEAWRPADEACVLTHGDACLPNVLFDAGRYVGFIDCGRVGVADPYQDLALAARSIGSNLGREWVPVFFEAYGLPNADERKLAFYRLLDEFF